VQEKVKYKENMLVSFHCELASGSCENFVSYDDFFLLGPPHLVSPDISVVHEVGHRDHGASESAYKGLSTDDREETEGHDRSEEAVFEPSNLPLGWEVVVLFQIAFTNRGDVRIVNQPVTQFALFSPRRSDLSSRFLVVGLLWFT
jgi:hypothetical protein